MTYVDIQLQYKKVKTCSTRKKTMGQQNQNNLTRKVMKKCVCRTPRNNQTGLSKKKVLLLHKSKKIRSFKDEQIQKPWHESNIIHQQGKTYTVTAAGLMKEKKCTFDENKLTSNVERVPLLWILQPGGCSRSHFLRQARGSICEKPTSFEQ